MIDLTKRRDRALGRRLAELIVEIVEGHVREQNHQTQTAMTRLSQRPLTVTGLLRAISAKQYSAGSDDIHKVAFGRIRKVSKDAPGQNITWGDWKLLYRDILKPLSDNTTRIRTADGDTYIFANKILGEMVDLYERYQRLNEFEAAISKGRRDPHAAFFQVLSSQFKIENPMELEDLDRLDEVLKILVLAPVIGGNTDVFHRNYPIIFRSIAHRPELYGKTEASQLRIISDVLSAGYAAYFRIGDSVHEALHHELARVYSRKKEDLRTEAKLRVCQHTRDILSRASWRAYEIVHEMGETTFGPGAARILSYAAESCIHQGADLNDYPEALKGKSIAEIISKAEELELKLGNFDGAMRFQTNIIRCHILRGRPEEALAQVDIIRGKLKKSKEDWPHVDMRVYLDECTAYYVLARKSPTFEREAKKSLEAAVKISKRLNSALMPASHEREYGKIAPQLRNLDELS